MLQAQKCISLFDTHKDGSLHFLLSIYTREYYTYYVYISRLTEAPDIAHELTAKTFIDLWERRNEVSTEKVLKEMLFSIANQHCQNYYISKQASMVDDQSMYEIWEKSSDFIEQEKKLAIAVGQLLQSGFLHPPQKNGHS